MPLKIDPAAKNIVKNLKNLSVPCPYSGKEISKAEATIEHIAPAPKNSNKYPFSKEELNLRLQKIEKQIKQNPDDVDLRKYYDVLKRII